MNWYYATGNQPAGPVSQADFDQLVASGTIKRETLVWREGMANWLPYGEAMASSPPGAEASATAAAAGGAGLRVAGAPVGGGTAEIVACGECGRVLPKDEVIRYGTVNVCASCKPAFLHKLREGVSVSGNMQYAGFWIRFVATFVDGIIQQLVNFTVGFLISMVMGPVRPDPNNMGPFFVMQAILFAIAMLIGLVYEVWFIGKYGATPGKMACKIRVVTANGGSVSYGRACGRYFAKLLSSIVLAIGYLMAAFDDEKRALHDRICDTRVIKNG